MHLRSRVLLCTGLLAGGLFAQGPVTSPPAPILAGAPAHGEPGRQPGSERWIVHFTTRSFDLDGLRAAILAKRPAAEVTAITADLEQRMQKDQAAFVADTQRLGARVLHQWWLVNAAAIEVTANQLDAVRRLPIVRFVEPDRLCIPVIQQSTNSQNHNADLLQAYGHLGQGVTVAVMDTGQDENMNGSGLPHRSYFLDGNPANTGSGGIGGSRLLVNRQIGAMRADDVHGHGTGVASVCASGGWSTAGSDQGHAPRAGIAGYAIADATNGSASSSTLVTAWQNIVADRVTYNIVAANNSYSGDPNPLGAVQQALDAAALNANILCCVAAANGGTSTAASQSAANGLAVGAVSLNAHVVAGFSSRGPLSGDPTRFYPDLAACGVSITMARRDNEGSDYVASGTSFASPQVAGAATQLRARFPAMTALEAKAVLLAAADDLAAANPGLGRNDYGMGLLKNDRAHQLAAGNNFGSATVTTGPPQSFTIPCLAGHTYAIAIAWFRHDVTSANWSDLDLTVKNASTLQILDAATSPRNLYEMLRVTPTFTGALRIETSAYLVAGLPGGGPQPFSWAWVDTATPGPDAVAYGLGCSGTGQPLGNCAFINASGTLAGTVLPAVEAAFQLTAPAPLQVLGFEVLSQSTGLLETVAASLWADASGLPSASPLATTTVTIGSAPGFYRAMFMVPVGVPAGPFWISVDHSAASTMRSALTAGAFTPSAERVGGVWQGIGPGRPGLVTLCPIGAAGGVPKLRVGGPLRFGTTTPLLLTEAPAATFALCGFGWSETTASFGALPFSLAPLGANCLVHMSADLLALVPALTSSSGQGSFGLGLPSTSTALYVEIYSQYVVLDPAANALGLTLSNGLRLTIGP